MALLDIYGLYNQAYDRYVNEGRQYNRDLNAFNKSVNDYNASIISGSDSYDPYTGNYSGGGPYTYYQGQTVGRTGTPIEQYQTDPIGYNTSYTRYGEEVLDPEQLYDYSGNLNEGIVKTTTPIYGGTNETTYVDPNTGLASLYASRPGEFTGVMPTEPIAPPEQEVGSLSNAILPESIYQSVFGRATPDMLSNEAWSLANLSSPFLGSESSTPYETGKVNISNNPLSYIDPNYFTLGSSGINQNTQIGGENPYY